jgi:predicted PurR-regulated permease PerM
MDEDHDLNNLPPTMTAEQVKTYLLARDVRELKKILREDLAEIKAQNKFNSSQLPEIQQSSTRNHEALEQLRKGIENKNGHIEEMISTLDKRLQFVEKAMADSELVKNARSNTLKPWMKWAWAAFQAVTNFVLIGIVAFFITQKK